MHFWSHNTLNSATQKAVYTPVWHPYTVTTARGHLYIAWLLWQVGLIFVGPTGLQPMEKGFLNSYHPKAQQETVETGLSVKETNSLTIMTVN